MPQEVLSRQALHQVSCRIILIQPFDKIIPTESLYNNPPCLPVAQLIQSHFLTGAPNLQIIVYISKGGHVRMLISLIVREWLSNLISKGNGIGVAAGFPLGSLLFPPSLRCPRTVKMAMYSRLGIVFQLAKVWSAAE